jgi:hypothetical protein
MGQLLGYNTSISILTQHWQTWITEGTQALFLPTLPV